MDTASQPKDLPLLAATGQDRSLVKGGLGFLTGLGAIYGASINAVSDLHPLAPFALAAVGAILAAAGYLLAAKAVKCPSCDLRLLPWAMSNRPVNDWLQWLYRVHECPRCGHRAS